jgi:hypothetical protein
MHSSSPPFVLHALPISSSFIKIYINNKNMEERICMNRVWFLYARAVFHDATVYLYFLCHGAQTSFGTHPASTMWVPWTRPLQVKSKAAGAWISILLSSVEVNFASTAWRLDRDCITVSRLQCISVAWLALQLQCDICNKISASVVNEHQCFWDINKKFWEELIAYFPLIRHGLHRKRRIQQFFYCCVCIRCSGNVSTEPLTNNDSGIHI